MADGFTNIQRKLVRAIEAMPLVLANEAVNHSLDAFKSQSWEGQQWRRRIYRKGEGRSLLIKTGAGRRSIRVISVNRSGFVYGSDSPYMAAHNEGFSGTVTVKAHQRSKFGKKKVGTGKFTKKGNERRKTVSVVTGTGQVRAHQRRMNLPRRQFAGNGKLLTDRLSKKGVAFITQQFNK